jgi:hypothetical protein
MDSDNFALLDPASLFDTKEYQEHGNLFWWVWQPCLTSRVTQLKYLPMCKGTIIT